MEGDLERLPDPQRTCVYRVVQEALTNCAKHSARHGDSRSQVVRGRTRLDVSVRDNGVGMDATAGHKGLGLTGIKERVKDMQRLDVHTDADPAAEPSCRSPCRCPLSDSSKENLVANSAR